MKKHSVQGTWLAVIVAMAAVAAVFLPGSQPGEGRTLEDPGNCGCHRGYSNTVEPMYNWRGSMMSMSARDPIFFAALDLANHDGDSIGIEAGAFCLRCHAPNAFFEGRVHQDPTGANLTGTDLEGVSCDFCHAQVDPLSPEGQSLQTGSTLVTSYGNAMYVITAGAEKRGPYSDPAARHEWLFSEYHRTSEVCASCHDVSNPLLCDPADPYNVQKCFTEQRTYSEWANSWYATQGETGNCQACHMPYMTGKACKQGDIRDVANFSSDPNQFVPVHHQNGGNTFIPEAIAYMFAGDNTIDFDALLAGKDRAASLLQTAATLEVFDATDLGAGRVLVRITNDTGHKLPTGYPEGRRMWINVVGYTHGDTAIFESGAYDFTNADLTLDGQAKVYEAHFGVLQADGGCETTFRLVRNNCLEKDNRIPPKGFTNAAFEAVGAGHEHYYYPDGQFWDDTGYVLPPQVARVEANLYYQTAHKEYIEFLASAPGSGQRGADLLAAFNATNKSEPTLMETASVILDGDGDGMADAWELAHGLDPANPSDGAGDLDGDGLSNLDEYLSDTAPDNPDTDGDGLADGAETSTDPKDPDTDGDGLLDGDEVNNHLTNPLLWDTDGGGEGDGTEVAGGRDPLDPSDDGEMAAYSPSLLVPECALGKSPCLVSEDLVMGRDNIRGGNEPNQPNTIYGSTCADGSAGDFHDAESIDSFMVTDLAGDTFQAGDQARLDATVWCWTDVGYNKLHVFYADSVTNPVWVHAGTTVCDAIDLQELGLTFTLPSTPGRTAIRAVFGYDDTGAAADACDGFGWTDRDDVVLHLAEASTGDADGDGLSDSWENAHPCMDPATADDHLDYDGDMLDNGAENGNSTDPCGWDTDGDFLPDGYEVANSSGHTAGINLDPLDNADGALNFDGDNNSNAHEYWNGSDPYSPDPAPNPLANPDCYYWGDGDGDGAIGPGDIALVALEIAGNTQAFNKVLPRDVFDTLDIDRDGGPGPGDKALLDIMLTGGERLAGYPSTPSSLSVEYQPAGEVLAGSTGHVTLSVLNAAGGVPYSSGFAVVFWVDDAASAGTATLLGGDGSALGQPAGNRYDVSGESATGALANVVFRVDSAGTIVIGAKIPACGTEPEGRWCGEVAIGSPIIVNP